MKSGLLWYDADAQAGLPEKVTRAARRYREKLGHVPTVCYVHTSALGDAQVEVQCRLEDGITVVVRLSSTSWIPPHHFWLGEEESLPAGAAQARGEVQRAAPSDVALSAGPLAQRPPPRAGRKQAEEARRLKEALAARRPEGSRRSAAKAGTG